MNFLFLFRGISALGVPIWLRVNRRCLITWGQDMQLEAKWWINAAFIRIILDTGVRRWIYPTALLCPELECFMPRTSLSIIIPNRQLLVIGDGIPNCTL